MATTVHQSSSSNPSPLATSSTSNEAPSTLSTSNKGILKRRPNPPSPFLKRALERTISVHTSMGKPIKRSIALAPSGPSSTARRISICKPLEQHASPTLRKSLAASIDKGSSTLIINTPGSPTPISRTKSKSSFSKDKVVGFDLSSRDLMKAKKLAERGFEEKTGKSWTLTRNKSQLDIDIYEQEVRKHHASMVSKKQDELNKEMEIQKSIESRYDQIAQLQRRLAEKEAELTANKSVAEQAKVDIQNAIKDQVMKGSAITDEKSSDVRMRLEQQKKQLKRQMINATAVDDPRRHVLQTQQEAEELRVIINILKKEIAKIKHDASFEKSSKARMKAAKKAKEDERASGIVKEYKPAKVKVAKPVVQKSHMARMEAEKQRKEKKRAPATGVTAMRASGGGVKDIAYRTLRNSGMIRQSSGLRSSGMMKREPYGSSSAAAAHLANAISAQ